MCSNYSGRLPVKVPAGHLLSGPIYTTYHEPPPSFIPLGKVSSFELLSCICLRFSPVSGYFLRTSLGSCQWQINGSGLADILPGVDLCTYPSVTAPDGQASNFNHPKLLRPLTVSLTALLTVLAAVFACGRLWANFKRRTWSDGKYQFPFMRCKSRWLIYICIQDLSF